MKIKREVNGVEYEFTLTDEELWAAKQKVEDACFEQDIRSRVEQFLEEALPDMLEEYKDWKHYGDGSYASDEDAIDDIIRSHLGAL